MEIYIWILEVGNLWKMISAVSIMGRDIIYLEIYANTSIRNWDM